MFNPWNWMVGIAEYILRFGLGQPTAGSEYPYGTTCIKESRLGSGSIIFTYHMMGYRDYWYDITCDIDPKGEKEFYTTIEALKTAIQQYEKLEEANKVIMVEIVEIIEIVEVLS